MLAFAIYLLAGFGYALYYDLNLLEAALVAVVVLCVYRGWTPRFSILPAWRAWVKLAHRRKTAVVVVFFSALAIRAALLPLLPGPSSGSDRRIQPALARRHTGSWAAEQSHSSDVDAFRKHPHHSKAHLQLRLFSGTGGDPGVGNARRASVDRGVGTIGRHVRRAVLDVAGLGAAGLGAVRRHAGRRALRHRELLDQQLLWRLSRGARRSAALGSLPALPQKTLLSPLTGNGARADRDRLHTAVRRAGRCCAGGAGIGDRLSKEAPGLLDVRSRRGSGAGGSGRLAALFQSRHGRSVANALRCESSCLRMAVGAALVSRADRQAQATSNSSAITTTNARPTTGIPP